jgi:hypothetical protein
MERGGHDGQDEYTASVRASHLNPPPADESNARANAKSADLKPDRAIFLGELAVKMEGRRGRLGHVRNPFPGYMAADGSECTVGSECAPGGGVPYCEEGLCRQVDVGYAPGRGENCPDYFCGQALVCDQSTNPGVCVEGPKAPVVSAEECNGTIGADMPTGDQPQD